MLLRLLIASLPLLGGCAGASLAGLGPSEQFSHPEYGGLQRAAFELECPKEKLHVQELGGIGVTVGVTGCNKRAVYSLTPSGWLNTTGSAGIREEPARQAPL